MTDPEYEASITAALQYDRFEGQHKLRQIDRAIAQLETTLARLQGQRRDIINQYDLNKQG